MTNRKDGTLYVGVTSDLMKRIAEHKSGIIKGFTQRYNLHRLVYFETFGDIDLALQREKRLKEWRRAWKVELIAKENPNWGDLYTALL
jgi:putative endonuclease